MSAAMTRAVTCAPMRVAALRRPLAAAAGGVPIVSAKMSTFVRRMRGASRRRRRRKSACRPRPRATHRPAPPRTQSHGDRLEGLADDLAAEVGRSQPQQAAHDLAIAAVERLVVAPRSRLRRVDARGRVHEERERPALAGGHALDGLGATAVDELDAFSSGSGLIRSAPLVGPAWSGFDRVHPAVRSPLRRIAARASATSAGFTSFARRGAFAFGAGTTSSVIVAGGAGAVCAGDVARPLRPGVGARAGRRARRRDRRGRRRLVASPPQAVLSPPRASRSRAAARRIRPGIGAVRRPRHPPSGAAGLRRPQ